MLGFSTTKELLCFSLSRKQVTRYSAFISYCYLSWSIFTFLEPCAINTQNLYHGRATVQHTSVQDINIPKMTKRATVSAQKERRCQLHIVQLEYQHRIDEEPDMWTWAGDLVSSVAESKAREVGMGPALLQLCVVPAEAKGRQYLLRPHVSSRILWSPLKMYRTKFLTLPKELAILMCDYPTINYSTNFLISILKGRLGQAPACMQFQSKGQHVFTAQAVLRHQSAIISGEIWGIDPLHLSKRKC